MKSVFQQRNFFKQCSSPQNIHKALKKVWKFQIQPFFKFVLYCWWQFCKCSWHYVPWI